MNSIFGDGFVFGHVPRQVSVDSLFFHMEKCPFYTLTDPQSAVL